MKMKMELIAEVCVGILFFGVIIFAVYFAYKECMVTLHGDDFMSDAVEELRGIRKALEKK